MVEVLAIGSCLGDHAMMGPLLFGSCLLLGCLGACELAGGLAPGRHLLVSYGGGGKTGGFVGFRDGSGGRELADLPSRSRGLGACEGVAFLSFGSGSESHGMTDLAMFVQCPNDHEGQDIESMLSRNRQVDCGRAARLILRSYGRVARLTLRKYLR